jgi:hypothetical protein
MGVLSRERDSGWHGGASSSAATAASSSASDATIKLEFLLILSCKLTGPKLLVKTHLQPVFYIVGETRTIPAVTSEPKMPNFPTDIAVLSRDKAGLPEEAATWHSSFTNR